MLQIINKFTARITMEPEIVTFVLKTAFREEKNLGEFKIKKNSSYGEFKI